MSYWGVNKDRRDLLVKTLLEDQALTGAAPSRYDICAVLGWGQCEWDGAITQQDREPYVFEQEDANNGWIPQDLVGMPAIVTRPIYGRPVCVVTDVQEVLDYLQDRLKPIRTTLSYVQTGTTGNLESLASATNPSLADAAFEADEQIKSAQRSLQKSFKDAEKARQLTQREAQLKADREALEAEKARLGL